MGSEIMRAGYRVELKNILINNYQEIKNGTYEWKDEEIELVYTFIGYVLDGLKVNENKEDLTQDLIGHVFNEGLKKMNLEKYDDPLTYLYFVIKNQYSKEYYLSHLQKRNPDKEIYYSVENIDKLPSKIDNPYSEYLNNKIINYLEWIEEKIKQDSLLDEYYNGKLTLKELSIKYNKSLTAYNYHIQNRLSKIKIEAAEKGVYELLDINDGEVNDDIRKSIEKKGILWTNVCKKYSYLEIARAINAIEKSVMQVVNSRKKEIRDRLNKNDLKVSSLGVDFYIYIFENQFDSVDDELILDLYRVITKNKFTMFLRTVNLEKRLTKEEKEDLMYRAREIKEEFNKKIKVNKINKR